MTRCRWGDDRCRYVAIAAAVAPESEDWTVPASVPVCGGHLGAARLAGWIANLRGQR